MKSGSYFPPSALFTASWAKLDFSSAFGKEEKTDEANDRWEENTRSRRCRCRWFCLRFTARLRSHPMSEGSSTLTSKCCRFIRNFVFYYVHSSQNVIVFSRDFDVKLVCCGPHPLSHGCVLSESKSSNVPNIVVNVCLLFNCFQRQKQRTRRLNSLLFDLQMTFVARPHQK